MATNISIQLIHPSVNVTRVTTVTLTKAEQKLIQERKTERFASEKNLPAWREFICGVFNPRMEEFISWRLSGTSVVLPVVAAGIKRTKSIAYIFAGSQINPRNILEDKVIPLVLGRGGPRSLRANAWNAKTRIPWASCWSNRQLCQFVLQHP